MSVNLDEEPKKSSDRVSRTSPAPSGSREDLELSKNVDKEKLPSKIILRDDFSEEEGPHDGFLSKNDIASISAEASEEEWNNFASPLAVSEEQTHSDQNSNSLGSKDTQIDATIADSRQKKRHVNIAKDFLETESAKKEAIEQSSPSLSPQISQDFLITNRPASELFSLTSKTAVMMQVPEMEIDSDNESKGTEFDRESLIEMQIDRSMYYEMYNIFDRKNQAEKIRNNLLHSLMVSYYMKRRMFYVIKDLKVKYKETETKYESDLENLGELREKVDNDKALLNDEIALLSNKIQSKSVNIENFMNKLQQIEQTFGKTLTFEKTGRTNMDKVVDRLLKQQKNHINTLSKLRLEYLHMKSKLNKKMSALADLDHLGPGYHIMDYVQLKLDNRNLHDRLEEKESELTQVRQSCTKTTQILAHNREKFTVVDEEIKKQIQQYEDSVFELAEARGQVSYLKKELMRVRELLKQAKQANGLLVQPNLLLDVENAAREVEILKREIETIKNEYRETSDKTVALRRNLDQLIRKKRIEEQRIVPEPKLSDRSLTRSSTPQTKSQMRILTGFRKRSRVFRKH